MSNFNLSSINISSPYSRPPDASTSTSTSQDKDPVTKEDSKQEQSQKTATEKSDTSELNAAEIQELTKLKQRDREVKAHEQAHIAAGGAYIRSGAQYTYQEGPDGKKYAIGGEVQIDTSPIADKPEATIRKMMTVRSAALAPANPSSQDRSVAAQASRVQAEMQMEIVAKRYEEAAAIQTGKPTPRPSGGTSSDKETQSSSPVDGIDVIG